MPARVNFAMAGMAVFLSACTTTTTITAPRAPYDFSKVKRISVTPFEGPGGSAATDEFVRQLLGTGLTVSDVKHSGDVVLRGTVTEYKANTPLMVFLGNTMLVTTGGQAVTVDNPVVAQTAAQSTAEGVAPGGHNAQVVSVMATVSVDVVLLDASSKILLWKGSQSYEGLELADALHVVIANLNQSLSKVIPKMRQPG
jgi:hypothetical protein